MKLIKFRWLLSSILSIYPTKHKWKTSALSGNSSACIFEIQNVIIRKGIENTLAFRIDKMPENKQGEVPADTNSIAMNTTQGYP